jgi:hypothetical protein
MPGFEEGPPPGLFDEDEAPSNVVPMRAGPTKDDPFRGLVHLPAIALFGRERILKLAATPVEYLWKDIAVAGTVILIAGPPSEGKTTLLFLILAVRLSLGEPIKLLDRELKPANPAQFIVLIEGEHSESSTSRKIQKSLTIMGVDDAGLRRIIVVARKAVLVGSREWLDVELMIGAGLVSDIGIDTLARVAPAEANDETQQVAIFNQLAKAIERAPDGLDRPTVWAIAHTRKNGRDGKDAGLGEVSGSVQRVGQSDTVLIVRGEKVDGQTVSTTVKFEKLREDPDDYPKPFTYSIVKGPDGQPCIAGVTKRDERPLEDRALDLMRCEARTKTWLGKQLNRSNSDIEVVITNLFDARAITSVKVNVGGRERSAFIAKPQEHRTGASDDTWYQTSIGRASDENE